MKYIIIFMLYSIPCGAKCIPVRIDNAFNTQQKKLINIAFQSWTIASNKQICFKQIEVDLSKAENFTQDGLSTIYSCNQPWQFVASRPDCEYRKDKCLAITIQQNDFTADIFVVGGLEKFLPLITHEIGHLIGLRHSQNYNDLMFGYIRSNMEISLNDKNRIQCLINNGKILNFDNGC